MKSYHRVVLLIGLVMMLLVAHGQAEDFYESRLSAGQEAYRQKRVLEALDQFRIAAFGFINTPTLLSESLARLALAQAAAGRSADVDATLSRFLDVERRFAPYAQIKLEPEIRAEFQALLLKRLSPATLQSVPGLAGLVETEEQKIAKLPSRDRRKALETALRREPGNVAWPLGLARESAQRQDHKDVLRWTGKALQLASGNAEALALQAHARAALRECAKALADLKALPQGELGARPELRADRFACLVESKDWTGAEAALKLVPGDLMGRSDVAQAEQKLAAERQRRNREIAASTQAAAKSPPTSPSKPPARTAGVAPAKTLSAASEASPAEKNPAGDSPPRLSERISETLAESRRLVQGRKSSEAAKILLEALRSEPNNRELRLALLEASCLSGAWSRGTEQIPMVTPFAQQEALPMFYAAVVLYETGRAEEARGYMERALPRVSGPFVDEYAKKILGRS
jgi:hypothetical protein